ncbi:MAG: hypothetical protein ACSHX6_01090 [Akkermansiaceae bacterium]
MSKQSDIQYAMEHSRVLREPDRRIDTFGNTRFHFVIISEMMDKVGMVIVRRGSVEAFKPKIIKPTHYSSVELEGFDDKARELLDWLKNNDKEPVFFQYGFNFKRTEVNSETVTGTYETVKAEILDKIRAEDDPMMAMMETIEDSWEIGLLKFSIDIIQKSQEINQFDFKRKGLL